MLIHGKGVWWCEISLPFTFIPFKSSYLLSSSFLLSFYFFLQPVSHGEVVMKAIYDFTPSSSQEIALETGQVLGVVRHGHTPMWRQCHQAYTFFAMRYCNILSQGRIDPKGTGHAIPYIPGDGLKILGEEATESLLLYRSSVSPDFRVPKVGSCRLWTTPCVCGHARLSLIWVQLCCPLYMGMWLCQILLLLLGLLNRAHDITWLCLSIPWLLVYSLIIVYGAC